MKGWLRGRLWGLKRQAGRYQRGHRHRPGQEVDALWGAGRVVGATSAAGVQLPNPSLLSGADTRSRTVCSSQDFADLPVAPALGHQGQHFPFPARQGLRPWVRRCFGQTRPYPLHHGRTQERLPGGSVTNRLHYPVAAQLPEDMANCSGKHDGAKHPFVDIASEEQALQSRAKGARIPAYFNPGPSGRRPSTTATSAFSSAIRRLAFLADPHSPTTSSPSPSSKLLRPCLASS